MIDVDRAAELRALDAHMIGLILDQSPLEHVDVADELGDELAVRILVDVLRRADLDDLARVHDADARRQRHRLFLVVRDDHEGDAELLLQVHQLELRVLAQLLVERAERLIEQQQLRSLHERTRERDALPLAAGQLMGLASWRTA